MTALDELKKELKKFGLTAGQSAMYIHLVQHSQLRIQDFVRLTHIPRSSVYENLKALFKLGLAEQVIEDSYKIIKPYPISALRHGLEERSFELKKLDDDLTELERNLALIANTKTPFPTTMRYYKDVAGARQLFWNSLKARNTVYVYSAWGRGNYVGLKFYENFVNESRARAIKEKVLINPNEATLESITKYTKPGSVLSRTNIKDIRVVNENAVLIKGDTLIYNNVYAQVYLKNEAIDGFEIESGHFVESQRSIFETLWKDATPVSRLLG